MTQKTPSTKNQQKSLQKIQSELTNLEDFRAGELSERTDISLRIKRRKQELENEAFEQDIKLKKNTLERLFIFLGIETTFIFLFAFFQAVKKPLGFHLEEWSFKVLVSATLIQITYMLQVAVRHLFPEKAGNKRK